MRLNWLNRTVWGILLATFLSDVSHEMCTSVLPLFLLSAGLGARSLGIMEGLADLVVCLSKLGGGITGRWIKQKRTWAAGGYLLTTLSTASLGFAHGLFALVTLRSLAWVGRGFRGPLRDDLLSNAVEKTHYGRVYGLERACDMLGAVAGPLVGTLLIWFGWDFRTIIFCTVIPGTLAAAAIFFLARDPESPKAEAPLTASLNEIHEEKPQPRFPRRFWLFLIGVGLFGLGDFSRSFLTFLAAQALGEAGKGGPGVLSIAALLYMGHNLISAAAAYPAGFYGDRRSKPGLLIAGYGMGVVTNLLLASAGNSLSTLIVAIVISGIYIAIEETLEKAVAAEMLPRELRTLGFGLLAGVNAIGDMLSSIYVGAFLEAGQPELAFGIAAFCGTLGVVWLLAFFLWRKPEFTPTA